MDLKRSLEINRPNTRVSCFVILSKIQEYNSKLLKSQDIVIFFDTQRRFMFYCTQYEIHIIFIFVRPQEKFLSTKFTLIV